MSTLLDTQTKLGAALPFWLSLILLPLAWVSAWFGGWTVALLPLVGWYVFGLLDLAFGLNQQNADPETPVSALRWHQAVTIIWAPLQALTLFGLIWYVPQAEHLASWERVLIFCGVGVFTGTIGINYSHELMHQSNRLERRLADGLLAMVLYSHFRSEHLLVHHRYVATPRDPVTARRGESFYRFYPRVLWQCLQSAWQAEAQMMERKQKNRLSRSNPFWMYLALQLLCLGVAFQLGGWSGVGLFILQASIAIWQLELVNYIEHYGLTRKYLGDGKYEHVQPRHSWNAAHRVSNWLLINLQRHSDHHYKPNRRYPVLQNYRDDEAPQLPLGYPLMSIAAMIPPLWRKIMHPRLQEWRRNYYPEIEDWRPYNRASNPMPR